ncbi:MAG: thioesterase [Bacteroidetes bacterium HGW-Bacteroidetes-8]|jgi:acyl-CoA thioester hydrolase|nr:MAG: thioesterase [Bacteroidetes bacterium HGW-Bacteroidetes-8]
MYKSETILEVRYYETDLMGIVHHSNYIRYFEWGRHIALVELGLPTQEIEKRGIMMPVVNVTCNYKTPAKQGDKLKIVTSVREMPKARFFIETEIYNELGEIVCTGTVTLGFINSITRKPTRVPNYIAELFEPYFNN